MADYPPESIFVLKKAERQMSKEEGEVSDKKFRRAIVKAVAELGVAAVADGLSVSKPTVERWCSGRNSPHPVMRPVIMKWIASKV
jgi:hypothetical protein